MGRIDRLLYDYDKRVSLRSQNSLLGFPCRSLGERSDHRDVRPRATTCIPANWKINHPKIEPLW